MAVRLPLIVSQPARRDVASTEMIENIVAAALLVPRLDANLVGDLSEIEPGSTDHLCLQGHGRDLILASYLSLDEANQAWVRLGQQGHFLDCHLDTAQLRAQARQVHSGRRIYYFQLNSATRITLLLDTCQELVNAQALQLVSIQLPIRPAVKEPNANSPSSAANRVANPSTMNLTSMPSTAASSNQSPFRPAPITQPQSQPTAATQPALSTKRTSLPLVVSREPDDDQEWAGLDQLVDDLDALDL